MGISIEEVESAVENFTPEELTKFFAWIDEFEQKVWDEKLLRDQDNPKLQELIDEADEDLRNGNVRDL
jgi:hypothetical protein